MMRGLALRILLIAAAGLSLLVLAGILFFQFQTRQSAAEVRLPLPDQALAIADLVEELPAEHLASVLRAVNDARFQARVLDGPVEPGATMSLMPAATWLGQRYIAGLDGRRVRFFLADQDQRPAPLGVLTQRDPVAMEIALKDGRYLLVEARGWVAERILALRLAWALLGATLIIGGASLWALRRQIRPLEHLVADVGLLGERLEPLPMPRGAAREVRQLVEALNDMQARILRLVAARSRMMAAISHDLGSYMTRLRLRAEFIGDTGQRDRAIADIAAMEALMVDALALARLEGEALPLEPLDLRALAHRAAMEAGEATVTVAADRAVPVRGRPVALMRVLTNLIGNAVKYGGQADISVRADGDSAELRVEDRGPGIPADERELVLEPFYRRDAARNLDRRGHGLGLAIVADIVRRHGGTMALGDRDGGGPDCHHPTAAGCRWGVA